METLVLEAAMETNVTRARPIIRAAAVTAVRPGWRRVFSRASFPVMPRHVTSTPIARARAGTKRGLSKATPTKTIRPPRLTRAALPLPAKPPAMTRTPSRRTNKLMGRE